MGTFITSVLVYTYYLPTVIGETRSSRSSSFTLLPTLPTWVGLSESDVEFREFELRQGERVLVDG